MSVHKPDSCRPQFPQQPWQTFPLYGALFSIIGGWGLTSWLEQTEPVSELWINLCLTRRGCSSRKFLFLPKVLLVVHIESHSCL